MTTHPGDRTRTVQAFAWTALTLSLVLLLVAGLLVLAAATGDGWSFLGYYYAAALAVFEVPALLLAGLAVHRTRTRPGHGQVPAGFAVVLSVGPLLLWALWGLAD